MTYEGKSESLILEKNSIQDDSIKISRGDGSMLFTALLMSAVGNVTKNIPRSAFKMENPISSMWTHAVILWIIWHCQAWHYGSLSPYLKLKLMSTFNFDSYEIHSDLNLKCPTFKELHLFEIPRFKVESEQRNLGSASIEPIIGLRMTPSIAEVAEKLVRKWPSCLTLCRWLSTWLCHYKTSSDGQTDRKESLLTV